MKLLSFVPATCLVVKIFNHVHFSLKYFRNAPFLRNLYTLLLLQSNLTISKPVDKTDNVMIIHLFGIQTHLLKRHKRSKVLFLLIKDEESVFMVTWLRARHDGLDAQQEDGCYLRPDGPYDHSGSSSVEFEIACLLNSTTPLDIRGVVRD